MWTVVKVPDIDEAARIVREVMDEWKSGVDAHDPGRVAALFTADAVFQGLRPYSVGPNGVFEYYDGQPAGMTVAYRLLEARRLGLDAASGYLAAEFSYRDRPAVHLNVGVVVVRTAAGWRIGQYQASPLPASPPVRTR